MCNHAELVDASPGWRICLGCGVSIPPVALRGHKSRVKVSRELARIPDEHLTAQICSLVREGCSPSTAAIASGVSVREISKWKDSARRGRPEYQAFFDAVLLAYAVSRCEVESEIKRTRPMDWITRGHARDGFDVFNMRDDWAPDAKTINVNGQINHAHTAARMPDLAALSSDQIDALEAAYVKALDAHEVIDVEAIDVTEDSDEDE